MTTRTTLPVGSLSRRQLLTVLVATPLVASFLAACGSDGTESSGSPSDPTTPTQPPSGLSYPTGADEVVVRIDSGVGAYTTPEYSFAEIPLFVVSGDGTVITPGPQIEIYPAPMLPALQSATLSSAQITELLERAESLGLLAAPPDYTATAPPIADAGSTVVTLNVNGTTYVHNAPALGLEQEASDAARQRLSEFVEFATTFVGAASDSKVFEPAEYVLGTLVVNVADYTGDIAPTVVPWPSSFGEVPVGEGCTTVDGATVRTELTSANQLTFFDTSTQEPAGLDIVQLLLRPVLPGTGAC